MYLIISYLLMVLGIGASCPIVTPPRAANFAARTPRDSDTDSRRALVWTPGPPKGSSALKALSTEEARRKLCIREGLAASAKLPLPHGDGHHSMPAHEDRRNGVTAHEERGNGVAAREDGGNRTATFSTRTLWGRVLPALLVLGFAVDFAKTQCPHHSVSRTRRSS